MKTKKQILLFALCSPLIIFFSCAERDYGANPYDPNTPITVNEMPNITSFTPTEGKGGDVITITGINFDTATDVKFGGKTAAGFKIVSATTIEAEVSSYGATGPISVTNHKGTKSLDGFYFISNKPVDKSNLAFEKTATASTEFTAARLAVDGDMSTRWSAEDGDDQWYLVDLGETYSINNVVIVWEGAFASHYDVLVSTDNVTFTTVYSVADYEGGTDEIFFDDIDARYVKIDLKLRGTPWPMSFWELEVYKIEPENLAFEKTATASTELTPARLAVDGDMSTRWSADEGDDHWFEVDLGEALTINNVIIHWEGAFASVYDVQVSTDKVDYTTVYSINDFEGGVDDITFADVEARYVKVNLYTRGTPWNMSFWELEIYKMR